MPGGSSGNCIYIGSDHTHLLVDAGISNKRIEQGLNDIGIKGSELDGVLITHEHSDHVKGLGVLARKHGVPIYSTRETLEEIKTMKSLGDYPEELLRPVAHDVDFFIGDLEIKPFKISHDAANPVAYRVQEGKSRWQWPRTWEIIPSTPLIGFRVWTLFFWSQTTM